MSVPYTIILAIGLETVGDSYSIDEDLQSDVMAELAALKCKLQNKYPDKSIKAELTSYVFQGDQVEI